MGIDRDHRLRLAAASWMLPQRVQSAGMLKAAVETAQALGRAKRAALFAVRDARIAPLVSTLEASQVAHASEVCERVAESRHVIWDLECGPDAEMVGDRVAFLAVPLCEDARVLGVLYLEGFPNLSPQIQTLVRRCGQRIAILLGDDRTAASNGIEADEG